MGSSFLVARFRGRVLPPPEPFLRDLDPVLPGGVPAPEIPPPGRGERVLGIGGRDRALELVGDGLDPEGGQQGPDPPLRQDEVGLGASRRSPPSTRRRRSRAPGGPGAESLPSRPAGDGDRLPADRRRQATRGWPRRPAGRPRLSPHRRRGIAWRRRRRRGGNAWRQRPARVPISSPSRPRRSSEAVVVAGGSGGSGRARYLVFISRGRAEAGIGRGCSATGPASCQHAPLHRLRRTLLRGFGDAC